MINLVLLVSALKVGDGRGVCGLLWLPEATESSGCSEAKGHGSQEGVGLPRHAVSKSRFKSQGTMTELDRGPRCVPELAEDT